MVTTLLATAVPLVAAAFVALVGWIFGHALALAYCSARWGGRPGMPPRLRGAFVGATEAALCLGAYGCVLAHLGALSLAR